MRETWEKEHDTVRTFGMANQHETNKAIGFDPVKWVERLRVVAEESKFGQAAKTLIDDELSKLSRQLVGLSDGR